MRSIAIATLAVLALARTAAAQPAVAPSSPPAAPGAELAPSRDDEVSEDAALLVAIGATAASYGALGIASQLQDGGARNAMFAAGALGTLIAPSTGRWYARSRGLRGLGLRLAGAGTGALAVALLIGQCGIFADDDCEAGGAAVLGVTALALYVGGTIDDLVMARRDARRHNERLRRVGPLERVVLVPMVRPGDSVGLAVAARF
jgi:hypothetical protein